MSEVRFYHLTSSSAEVALPQLLGKTLERDKRALVKLTDAEVVDRWNEHLWAYDEASFLPHGSIKDAEPETQPIFLTHVDENPARAEYLFLIGPADREDLAAFDMTAILFDGHDEEALTWARGRWSSLKDAGLERSYWQQDENGRWGKKA